MDLSIGLVRNENQFIHRVFSEDQIDQKIMDLEEIDKTALDGLILAKEFADNVEILELLSQKSQFFPIQNSEIGQDDFSRLGLDQAQALISQMQGRWKLNNNLSLIENLFSTLDHLHGLYPNDRSSFFEELWFLLRSNILPKDLRLFYNDRKVSGKNDRGELVQVRIEGQYFPNPIEGGEFDKKIMEHFSAQFDQAMTISEFSSERQELVLCGNIQRSPYVVMAKVAEFGPLQKAGLNALFEGLSRTIN